MAVTSFLPLAGVHFMILPVCVEMLHNMASYKTVLYDCEPFHTLSYYSHKLQL